MRKTLKLRFDVPYWVEDRLRKEFGFNVTKRVHNQFVLMSRFSKPLETTDNTPTSKIVNEVIAPLKRAEPLSLAERRAIEARCDRIVNNFIDPYKFENSIRMRLHTMRQSLKTAEEQQVVLEYLDENFPGD